LQRITDTGGVGGEGAAGEDGLASGADSLASGDPVVRCVGMGVAQGDKADEAGEDDPATGWRESACPCSPHDRRLERMEAMP
jgi:hypothetical protein